MNKESIFKFYEKGIAILNLPLMGTAYLFYRAKAEVFIEDWEAIAKYMWIEQWYKKNFNS